MVGNRWLGRHALHDIFVDQGEKVAVLAVRSYELGVGIRAHAATCSVCTDIINELFPDGEIDAETDPFTPEVMEIIESAEQS